MTIDPFTLRRACAATLGAGVLAWAATAGTGAPAQAATRSAPSPAPARPVPGRTAVSLDSCHPDPVAANRYAMFSAEMDTVGSTQRMSIRFDLLRRAPHSRGFHRVRAPGLGQWQTSDPGVAIFRLRREVTNLSAPATYRAVVRFRWSAASGRVIRRAHAVSADCRQPDQRAHLAVGQIGRRAAAGGGAGAGPGTGRSVLYTVEVFNRGPGPAGAFDVAFTVAGQALAPQSVAGLARGRHAVVTFTGPACGAGSSLQATVDPRGGVAQTTRSADTKTVAC